MTQPNYNDNGTEKHIIFKVTLGLTVYRVRTIYRMRQYRHRASIKGTYGCFLKLKKKKLINFTGNFCLTLNCTTFFCFFPAFKQLFHKPTFKVSHENRTFRLF